MSMNANNEFLLQCAPYKVGDGNQHSVSSVGKILERAVGKRSKERRGDRLSIKCTSIKERRNSLVLIKKIYPH